MTHTHPNTPHTPSDTHTHTQKHKHLQVNFNFNFEVLKVKQEVMREGARYECKKSLSPGLRLFLHSYQILILYLGHFWDDFRFIIYAQDGSMYKEQFPIYNSISPKIGLRPFFIFIYSIVIFIHFIYSNQHNMI